MVRLWFKGRRYLAAGVAFISCPCHLVVTLPLLLSLTGGTAVGAFLSSNIWLIIAVSFLLFGGSLALAYRWWGAEAKSCRISAETGRRPGSVANPQGKEVTSS